MADRENAIKRLKYLHDVEHWTPSESSDEAKARRTITKEAIELLRAKEPRVLRLDEIHRGMALWIEYKEKPSWLTGFGDITNYKPVTLAIGGASCGGARCFIDEFAYSFAVNDADYNIRWRAWTKEPTEEQRKEVRWNA